MGKMFFSKELLEKFEADGKGASYHTEGGFGCSSNCEGTCDGTMVGDGMCTYSDTYITSPNQVIKLFLDAYIF